MNAQLTSLNADAKPKASPLVEKASTATAGGEEKGIAGWLRDEKTVKEQSSWHDDDKMPCTIERRPFKELLRWRKGMPMPEKPRIYTNATAGWGAEEWTREVLLERYGEVNFLTARPKDLIRRMFAEDAHKTKIRSKTLGDFVDVVRKHPHMYTFDRLDPRLEGDLKIPEALGGGPSGRVVRNNAHNNTKQPPYAHAEFSINPRMHTLNSPLIAHPLSLSACLLACLLAGESCVEKDDLFAWRNRQWYDVSRS